jgi:hypothetical protein
MLRRGKNIAGALNGSGKNSSVTCVLNWETDLRCPITAQADARSLAKRRFAREQRDKKELAE